ncbi:hypothetical protein USDA257_p05750 (plasmid) [Sinorhizobium fredii USDA 257]|uniref:Uncharacterized protein n=1 Tax=Sinorhizobium fredii (strain USDA 257) TaxID=1185652 RepID=I3XHD4_SINF2|nr:hypothetical protein USDA257_p05750 [Sinorhizobium fredii USDA 257]
MEDARKRDRLSRPTALYDLEKEIIASTGGQVRLRQLEHRIEIRNRRIELTR